MIARNLDVSEDAGKADAAQDRVAIDPSSHTKAF